MKSFLISIKNLVSCCLDTQDHMINHSFHPILTKWQDKQASTPCNIDIPTAIDIYMITRQIPRRHLWQIERCEILSIIYKQALRSTHPHLAVCIHEKIRNGKIDKPIVQRYIFQHIFVTHRICP